jgi:hypothetical protein
MNVTEEDQGGRNKVGDRDLYSRMKGEERDRERWVGREGGGVRKTLDVVGALCDW